MSVPSKRRDRRGRGLRGPLAWPNRWTEDPVPLPRRPRHGELFSAAVANAVARVGGNAPDVIAGVTIGVEEVPGNAPWTVGQVPLAAAIEATPEQPAHVVLYRRPIEHRAATTRGLHILVHRTLVEQLAALTGRSVADLDPGGLGDIDD